MFSVYSSYYLLSMGWYSLTLPLTVTSLHHPTPSIHTISSISIIITVLIYEIFLRNPSFFSLFFHFLWVSTSTPTHYHPKDTAFFPQFQAFFMTICPIGEKSYPQPKKVINMTFCLASGEVKKGMGKNGGNV